MRKAFYLIFATMLGLSSYSFITNNAKDLAKFTTKQEMSAKSAMMMPCPTPKIVGDLYGCRKTSIVVKVDTFFSQNTYAWSITAPATITPLNNGQASISLPDSLSGSYTILLIETDTMECSINASAVAHIEQNSSMACEDNLYISMDDDCAVPITSDMILEGFAYPDDSYTIVTTDPSGNVVPNNIIRTASALHKMFTVSITHKCSGNSCWGKVTMEDKSAPVLECPDPVTISCFNTTTNFPPAIATDNCDLQVPAKLVSNVLTMYDCGNDFAAVREITYTAEDDWGNKSLPCVQTIYYAFESISDIEFPLNRTDVESTTTTTIDDPLYCEKTSTWDKNNNYYPDIEETGFPTLDGNPIKETNGLCKINAVFSDQRLDECEKSFKVIRTWTILDWCTGELYHATQIIKVLDVAPPLVVCPEDFKALVYTRPYECLADYPIPPPTVIYECSSWDYIVEYILADVNGNPPINGVYIDDNVVRDPVTKRYTIKNLPKGFTWIKYTVTDACHNTSVCLTEVYVQDNIPPVAVCDEVTVVALQTSFVPVFASTFDDGSNDNCTKVGFEAARMTGGCGESTTTFKESIVFCCEDAGKEIMVQMRVWDDANCNDIYGDEIDVYLDKNRNGIYGDQGDVFVRKIKDNFNTCMVRVKVQDKTPPVITCPKNLTVDCLESYAESATGTATAVDNCPGVVVTVSPDAGTLDNCQRGTIMRRFTATDKSGNTATCTQNIRVEDKTPFTEANIIWTTVPDRTLTTGCTTEDISPDKLGKPTWTNGECSLIATQYEDQVYHFVEDVCTKIIRRWTVIDWCTFNQNNSTNDGKYEYAQVIKINDLTKPKFRMCKDITTCIEGPNCNGPVVVHHPADDVCTDSVDLKYLYSIEKAGTIIRAGNTISTTLTLEPGIYNVKTEVTDGCNNRDNCAYVLTVKDCKKPTPYCYADIVTVVMNNQSETVSIWARDFNLNSTDNCPGVLKYSFSTVVSDTGRVFGCDDLGLNELNMWVTDASGNQDFCRVQVEIQANGTVCDGVNRMDGKVITENNFVMPGVLVQATSLENALKKEAFTNDEGKYSLYNLKTEEQYQVVAHDDRNILNGVSTLDLVLIQRHILGLNKLNTPHKIIAADINSSKSISAADLVSLRKVILGVANTFPNNSSWRFVHKAHTFTDPTKPWPFAESINMNGAITENTNYDFTGIKIGDVNGSVVPNLDNSSAKPRSNNVLALYYTNEKESGHGDVVKIAVKSGSAYTMYGFQTTLDFNIQNLTFAGIEDGRLNLTEETFATNRLEEGLIPMSFASENPISLRENDILFTLVFKTNTGSIEKPLTLSDKVTTTEVYDADMNTQAIVIEAREFESQTYFNVLQNRPNPFNNVTTIEFELGLDTEVKCKFYDISGKLVYKYNALYKAGRNEIQIKSTDLGAPGLYTYSLESSLGKIVKKIVLIE